MTSQRLLSNIGPFEKKHRQAHIHAKRLYPVGLILGEFHLHFPLHGVRRVLSLFARPFNVSAETVNRVASHVRA
jgi:hypothetical protein